MLLPANKKTCSSHEYNGLQKENQWYTGYYSIQQTWRSVARVTKIIKNLLQPVNRLIILCETEALASRLYGLQKIHSKNTPRCPIVTSITLPTFLTVITTYTEHGSTYQALNTSTELDILRCSLGTICSLSTLPLYLRSLVKEFLFLKNCGSVEHMFDHDTI